MRAGIATDQWKRTTKDWVAAANDLFNSMSVLGFMAFGAIPIDHQGELLGGAHRLACAIALDIDMVPIERSMTVAWAPPWHRDWFIEHGISAPDLARLDDDWKRMQ